MSATASLAVRRAIVPSAGAGVALPAWLAGLNPIGPPPPAILHLRSLALPAPRGPVDPMSARRWAQRAAARLEAVGSGAARPALGPVPTACAAVCFADQAELLACLARDVAHGIAAERWWWRSVAPAPDAAGLANALRRDLAMVPIVFQRLSKTQEAALVADCLGPQRTEELWQALARHAGLVLPAGEERATLKALSEKPAWHGMARPAGQLSGGWGVPRTQPAVGAEPWRELAPEASMLPRGHAPWRLLVLALVLAREPRAAQDIARSIAAADGEAGAVAFGDVSPRPAAAGKTDKLAPTHPNSLQAQSLPELSAKGFAAPAPPLAAPAAPMPGATVPLDVPASPMAMPFPSWIEPDLPLPAPMPEWVLETRFGGLLFLLNAFLSMRLYRDFTAPRAARLPLSPWDLLALLGAQACGARLRADPIWALLARLAGRAASQRPGQGFRPPCEWLAAPDWILGLRCAGPWRMHRAGGRLRLLHPVGIPVVDVPASQAKAALAHCRLRRRPQRMVAPPAASVATLEGWQDAMSAVLAARIEAAMGVPARQALAWLVAQPARIRVTATSLTADFDLAAHPIALRRAGLDRDPGWIPAAGLDIRFEFSVTEKSP